jgi:hypothetical protein
MAKKSVTVKYDFIIEKEHLDGTLEFLRSKGIRGSYGALPCRDFYQDCYSSRQLRNLNHCRTECPMHEQIHIQPTSIPQHLRGAVYLDKILSNIPIVF